MRYGVVLPIQSIGQDLHVFLDQLLAESVAAEKAGFDAVFLPEFHQARGGAVISPLIVGASILRATEKIKFGTAVLAAPLHHPVRLAEDSIMLDWLSRGRFILGLGVGHQAPDFAAYGAERSKRAEITKELLQVLNHCFSGEKFEYCGDHYQLNAEVTPVPYTDPRPPLWVGAHSQKGIERAAEWADLWLADPQRHIDVIASLASDYRRYCASHQRNPTVGIFREAWIADSRNEVEKVWGSYALAVHRLYYNVGVYRSNFEPWVDNVSERSDFTFDLLAPGRFLCGTGAEILTTVNEWKEKTGCEYLALRFRHPGGPSHEETIEALSRFGSEVISQGESIL